MSLLRRLYDKVGPEVRKDESSKIVELRGRYFFSRLTEAYYTLKGYETRRVSTFRPFVESALSNN